MVINEATFKFFYQNYNGGPEIVISAQDDIYANLLYISPKDFFLYASLKEAESNSVDESNISEMNNTDLSTKFSKNPNSSKLASKLRNLNNPNHNYNKQNSNTNTNTNLNTNENLNLNAKKKINNNLREKENNELSEINEGNEVSIMSKDEDPNLHESENFRRIYSGESNSLKSDDESGLISKMNLNLKQNNNSYNNNNNLVFNSNENNFTNNINSNANAYNNNIGSNFIGNNQASTINSNLINLKLSANSSNFINNANNNNNVLMSNRDDLSRNKNNFETNSGVNFNSVNNPNEYKNKINIGVGNKNMVHPVIRNANANVNLAINQNNINNLNINVNSIIREKENKK